MRKILAPVGIAGLAASALAVAVPITAHAAAGTTGPCSGDTTGNPVQHTGSGHHSFTDSHNNCVNFVGVSDTAFLNDSNFNLVNMFGSFDTVHDFNNSSHNSIQFDSGANGDALSATNANGNSVEFAAGAVNDTVMLLATADTTGLLLVPGTVSNAVLEFSSACTGAHTVPTADNGLGTQANPIIIC